MATPVQGVGPGARKTDVQTVIESDFVPLYNPFREYVDALPPWDGTTDHIGRLAAQVHVKEDGELFVRFFKKWLVAMLARNGSWRCWPPCSKRRR